MFSFLRSLIKKYLTYLIYLFAGGCAFATGAIAGSCPHHETVSDTIKPPVVGPQDVPKENGLEHMLLPPGPERQAGVPSDLPELLRQGKARLLEERLVIDQCGGRGTGWQRCESDYLLSARSPDGAVQTIAAYEGRDSIPPGFTITTEDDRRRIRGVNVPFAISHPPGWTVLALRTSVPIDLTNPDADHGAVYIPYTSRIDTPEMRSAGARYLESIVHQAFDLIKARNVRSRYAPSRRVDEIVSPEHLMTLILNEQTYHDRRFVEGGVKERVWMTNRSLVLLGANLDDAWSYTRSHADAVGIAQIIGSTYKLLQDAYPAAQLEAVSFAGRRNHVNSVMTMILHTDDELQILRNLDITDWMRQHPADWQLVLAAGYNANVANTVQRSVRMCDVNWRQEPCSELPEETKRYLIKYEWLREVLFNEDHNRRVSEDFAKDPY